MRFSFFFFCATLLIAILGYAHAGKSFLSQIEKGRAHYALAHYRNPILGLPTVDLEELRIALDGLKNEEEKVLATFPTADQLILQNALHPWSFLESLEETEIARRALLEHSNRKQARQYHKALLRTLEHYEFDLTLLIKTLSELPDTPLVFAHGETRVSFIKSVLEIQREKIQQLKKQEQKLYYCSMWWSEECDSYLSWVNDIPEPNSNFRTTLTQQEKRLLPILRSYQSSYTHKYLNLPEQRPTETPVVILKTSCFGSREKEVAFLVWFENDTPFSAKLSPISDFYFQNWRHGPQNPLTQSLAVTYEYQPYNPYFCPDFGIDSRKAFTALAIHRALQVLPPNIYAELGALAHSTTPPLRSIINADHMSSLAHTFARYLDSTPRSELVMTHGEDVVRRIEHIVILEKTGSSMFEHVAAGVDDTLRRVAYSNTIRPMPLTPFFGTRSHASLFFFITHDLDKKKMTLLEHVTSETPSPIYLSYTQNKEKIINEKGLLAFMLSGTRATDALFGPRSSTTKK